MSELTDLEELEKRVKKIYEKVNGRLNGADFGNAWRRLRAMARKTSRLALKLQQALDRLDAQTTLLDRRIP